MLIAAKFDHATSRAIDPQLHSHVIVLNVVANKEGNWIASKSLGLLYRQELAHELPRRGFEVEIQDRSQMFIELAGVDPRLIEHCSTRRAEIDAQVALWKEEGGSPRCRTAGRTRWRRWRRGTRSWRYRRRM